MPEQADASLIAKEFMRREGMLKIRSHGTSMFPFIREGDLCTFEAPEARSGPGYRPGDVLLAAVGSGLLVGHRLHRIERMRAGMRYRLKGDANLRFDDWLEEKQILGKLVLIERQRRTIRMNGPAALVWSRCALDYPRLSRLLRRITTRLLGVRRKLGGK